MNRPAATGLAGLACATLTLGTLTPAIATQASTPALGIVQAALTALAKSPQVVGAIGEVYVDGKLAGKGSAGTRLIGDKGRPDPRRLPFPRRLPDQADDGRRGAATGQGGQTGPGRHKNGKPRDIDRLNTGYGYAAGGVISTAHDISAFQRAFMLNKLLPQELKEVIMSPPKSAPQPSEGGGGQEQPPPLPCGGEPRMAASMGSAPGFNAVTFNSPDGRLQLAISAALTVSNTDSSVQPLLVKAAEAVFCPGR